MQFITWFMLGISTLAMHAQLQTVWTNTFRSSLDINNPDHFLDAVLDQDRNAYLTGGSYTIKYNSDGTLLWKLPLPSNSLLVLDDGSVVTLGIGITKVDKNGKLIWANTNVLGRSVQLDSSKRLTVLGLDGFSLYKVEPTGEILWATHYTTIAPDGDAFAISQTLTGETFLVGIGDRSDPSLYRILTIKVDAEGQIVWFRNYARASNSVPQCISVDSLGNICITGAKNLRTAHAVSDLLVLKYDSTGSETADVGFNSVLQSDQPQPDYGFNVECTGAGEVIVAATVTSGARRGALLKFSPQGQKMWASFFENAGEFVALETNGEAYVLTNYGQLLHFKADGTRDWEYQVVPHIGKQTVFPGKIFLTHEGELYVTCAVKRILSEPFSFETEYFAGRFRILSATNLPSIAQISPDQIVKVGTSVNLMVEATESQPGASGLNYQWLFQGNPIPEATNADLTVTNVTSSVSGWYSVVVSNEFGSVYSPEILVAATTEIEKPKLSDPFAFSFKFPSETNQIYGVETSTDLREWHAIFDVTSIGSTVHITDKDSPGVPKRYYRVVPRFRNP